MRIAVCLNLLPSLKEKSEFQGSLPDFSNLNWKAEPSDLCAYYKALELKEKYGHFVTIVTLQSDFKKYENTFRRTAAAGADRAVWLKKHGDSITSVARVYGSFFKNNKVDLIMTGSFSEKYLSSTLPVLIAGYAGLPSINFAEDVNYSNDKALVVRKKENHKRETLSFSPDQEYLISVSSCNKKYYPGIYDRYKFDKKEINYFENICCPDEQVYESSRVFHDSSDYIKGALLPNDPEKAADKIVEIVEAKGVLLK